MPGIAVHTWLALELLARWNQTGLPKLATEAPQIRAAMQSGALGPDMGMFPGGNPFLSDLAHYVRSGELARNLLRLAETEVERAFAWGWASHVLAERALPSAGESGGRRALASRPGPRGSLCRRSAGRRARRDGVGRLLPGCPAHPAAPVVPGRLRRPHDRDPAPGLRRNLRAGHRPLARAGFPSGLHEYSRWLLTAARINGSLLERGGVPWRLWPVYGSGYLPARWLGKWFVPRSPARGLFQTVRPGPWFFERERQIVEEFFPQFFDLAATRLESLPRLQPGLGPGRRAAPEISPHHQDIGSALSGARRNTRVKRIKGRFWPDENR